MTTIPTFDPANFPSTPFIDNRLLPLVPETTYVYNDGTANFVDTVIVTEGHRRIDGVDCIVVTDVAVQDGQVVEKTSDYYAQDNDGNVWYFGEATRQYENGHLVGKEGSWLAGQHGAEPGIVMLADPQLGDSYDQENAPGVAQDHAEVTDLGGTATVPYPDGGSNTFTGLLVTHDTNLLEPDASELKFYLSGVGVILTVDEVDHTIEQLVSVTTNTDDNHSLIVRTTSNATGGYTSASDGGFEHGSGYLHADLSAFGGDHVSQNGLDAHSGQVEMLVHSG